MHTCIHVLDRSRIDVYIYICRDIQGRQEAIGNGGWGYGMSAFNWHNARIGGTHEPTIFSRYVISWPVVGVVALVLAIDAVVAR
jgi:hypothetical protein